MIRHVVKMPQPIANRRLDTWRTWDYGEAEDGILTARMAWCPEGEVLPDIRRREMGEGE